MKPVHRVLALVVILAAGGYLFAASGSAAQGRAVLVGFHSAPGDAELAAVAAVGGTVTHRYKYIPAVAATIPDAGVDTLKASALVAYVEDDHQLYLLGGGKQVQDWGVRKIEAPAAWSLGFRGENVKVGIFDSGIDLEHADLQDAIDGGVDLIGDGRGFDDCNGHGTHVAGIVGARDNGTGTVGVAPRSRLYAMRFFDCVGGGATKSREIMGIEWAIDNGIQVINMSFGCCNVGGQIVAPIPNAAEEAALNEAYKRGIVLIAASGNAINNTAGVGSASVSYPAGYASVVAVGATDDEDKMGQFSSYGTDQELTAPGVAILSSVPVGTGQTTELTADDGTEFEAIGLAFAGLTRKTGLTAETIYAGLGTAADFTGKVCTGKTALVTRGGTSFAEKTVAAMNAGCAGIVIHNNQPGNFSGTLGTATAPDGRAWIPAVSISLDEGLKLKEQADARTITTTLLNVTGNHAVFNGTSMASPHAAGVAALVLGKNPALGPEQVRQILRESADDRGLPGWDPQYGYGRINALRAVQR